MASMSDPHGASKAGQRLDRHHPADLGGTLSSCSKCGFMIMHTGEHETHVPTDTFLPEVDRLLVLHHWPDADERLVHSAIKVAAGATGFPVSVDQVVEAIWPGYARQVADAHVRIEPLTPMVSHIIRADGRWGRLEVEERENGHHLVYGVVLDASLQDGR